MKLDKEIKRIAVFRALQLGDLLCAVPAVRALRQYFPHAEIHLISLPWAAGFASRFEHYFDDFHVFAGYPGLPEQAVSPADTIFFLKQMQDLEFDLVLQMQGNGTFVNPMIALFGARQTAGFFVPGDYCPDPLRYMPYPEGMHEIKRHLALMSHLGIPSAGLDLEFPIHKKDEDDLRRCGIQLAGRYICIHPGSRGSYRQWPPAHFSRIGDLCSSLGFAVVITGTASELDLVEKVAAGMSAGSHIAAGQTTLGAQAVLLRESAGLVSNCTGVSHMAAALQVPSVVISMDGEPERWQPLDQHMHRTLDWTRNPSFDTIRDWTVQMLESAEIT